MPPSRLKQKRAARAQRPGKTRPPGPSRTRKYRDMIVTTLITLLITGLFGDFVIKRNIQSYNRELEAFERAAKEADSDFSEKRAFYSSRLKDRRRASQQIIKYIKDEDIAAFNAAYSGYSKTVRAWNDDHAVMAELILEVTQCDTRFADTGDDERIAAFAPAFDFHMGLPGHQPVFDAFPGRAETVHRKFIAQRNLCPTYFLTRAGTSAFSVHEQFRRIHRNIYNYLVNNHSECRLRHIQNLPAYYRSCSAAAGEEPVQDCTRRYDALVGHGALCSHFDFDIEDYKVKDIEFNQLDFYWGLGDSFFKTFREDYILRECEKRIGFWGGMFGWSCTDAVAAYLRQDG